MFMAGVQGLLANPQDRGRAMLQGAQAGVQMQSAQQLQQMRALQLKQAQNAANFNPADYMKTTPTQGSAVQDQQIAQQPQQMPAALGGALGGAMPMMQQSPQAMQNTPIPQPAPGTPTGRVNMPALLQAGMQAGMQPAEIQGLAGIMDPQTAMQMQLAGSVKDVPPGGMLINGLGQKLGENNNPPVNDPSAVLTRTMVAARQARASGNIALADQLDAKVQHDSGIFDQQMKQVAMDNTQAQREATNAMREEGLGMRRDSLANVQAQREQQNQFQVDKQAVQLGTQLEHSGIPQADQTLNTIEGIIAKYPKGQLPGYGPVQGLLPMSALNEDGQQLRQAVAQLANINLKQRSGAAVTQQEYQRFRQELGTSAFLPEDRIRQGITQMRGLVESQKQNYAAAAPEGAIQTYEQNGGMPLSQYRHPRQKISIENATADDIAAAIRRKQGK